MPATADRVVPGLLLCSRFGVSMHSYGAYGMNLPLDYHPAYACMLERGWVLAFAHVRGGGERGKAWHASGRGSEKWNSFWDLEVMPRAGGYMGCRDACRTGPDGLLQACLGKGYPKSRARCFLA